MKRQWDALVDAKRAFWKTFLVTFAVLCVLTAGLGVVYGFYTGIARVPVQHVLSILGYLAAVSLVFCFVTRRQMHRFYDEPMRALSRAAEQVAGGDFTVWIEPIRGRGKTDYIDAMFEDFNKMVEELASIETLKDDFVAGVSHEIKTPLSVIQNYAVALQKTDLSSEQREEYVETIIAAAHRLGALVEDILKLSKLENQQITPIAEPFDLCRQLCDCALSFENLWEEKGIEFEAVIEDRALICADEGMLEIVWSNLLANALKFTDPGGKVTLSQTSDEETITVSVTDTGCGISEEAMKHIFDKFYQGDTSHSQEGNGLGLALSLKVIELVRGSIEVKSTPGEGTTFSVRLPIE